MAVLHLYLLIAIIVGLSQQSDPFKETLDDMEVHYSGPGHTFDNKLYQEIIDCFNKDGDNLLYNS